MISVRDFERIAMEWMRKHKACLVSSGWCLPLFHDDGCQKCVSAQLDKEDKGDA